MNKTEILSRVTDVFRVVFEDPNLVVVGETTADDIEAWDSLTHMILISEIEKKFGVRFKLNDIMNFKNVGDTIDCLFEKGV